MAGVLHEFFDQHAVVAERRLGLALGADDRRRKLAGRIDRAHAAPAAAGGRLHQHGETDLVGGLCQRCLVLRLAVIAGHQRHAGLFHQRLRARLRAHRRHHLGGRTDEHQSGIEASLRELGIFRQEAVAGMDGLGAGLARGFDHAFDVEIAVARPRRPEQHGLVGHGDMHGVAVGLRIDRDGAQAHGAGGADDAAGDLAAVGDQQRAKTPVEFCAVHHRFLHHILNRPNFVGSIGAFAAADNPRPSTSRVSAGSITPSSHSRAVA